MIRPLAAAAMLILSAVPAAYAADAVPKGVAVAYGDLDLGTVAGQSELLGRLRSAAAALCSPELMIPPDSEPTVKYHLSVYNACVGRLSERAMAKVKTARN